MKATFHKQDLIDFGEYLRMWYKPTPTGIFVRQQGWIHINSGYDKVESTQDLLHRWTIMVKLQEEREIQNNLKQE